MLNELKGGEKDRMGLCLNKAKFVSYFHRSQENQILSPVVHY